MRDTVKAVIVPMQEIEKQLQILVSIKDLFKEVCRMEDAGELQSDELEELLRVRKATDDAGIALFS